MVGPLTDSSEVVANYLFNKMESVKDDLPTPVQIVYYGDQKLLERTPAICVLPGPKSREFQGASLMTLNIFETTMYVYFGKIQDVQENLHACTTLAEAIEPIVHNDFNLGGNVTSVLCTANEPGLVTKMGDLMVASRLTFRSMSKTRLLS